jgi:hypothetical protein
LNCARSHAFNTVVSARVAGSSMQEWFVKILFVAGAVAFVSMALGASVGIAGAQPAVPSSASSPAAQPAAPLQLQMPVQPMSAVPPAETSDNAIVDAQDNAAAVDDGKRGPQVHGSFTAGIGYSKGYGTSTLQAADLDISDESDSGNTYDVRIHVEKTKGLGFGPYGGYYGPRIHGD